MSFKYRGQYVGISWPTGFVNMDELDRSTLEVSFITKS